MTAPPAGAGDEIVVGCAECGARYVLPDDLMGRRGARVRCRECGASFDVWRPPDAAAIAAEVVEELADCIPAIAIAQARGRLFAEAGELLFEAFDAWRRRAGERADAAVFREALRRRWEVEVPGPTGSWPPRHAG